MASLGKRLRRARKRRNISMMELSTRAGVSRAHLYMVEADQQGMTTTTLRRVLRVLGASAAELLDPEPRHAPRLTR